MSSGMTLSFFDLIRRRLLAQPGEVLLRWPDADGKIQALTGQDVLGRVEARREALRKAGLRPGTGVVLLLPFSPELLLALLAVMAEGAVPILPPARPRLLDWPRLVWPCGAALLLTSRPVGWGWRVLGTLMGVKTYTLSLRAETPVYPSKPGRVVDPAQAALISYSSGSTGQAKPIRRSHAVLSAQHRAIADVFPPWNGQCDFPLFPNILLHNLCTGVRSVVPAVPWPDWRLVDPERILDQMEQEGINTLTGNVFYFATLVKFLRQHPRSLKGVRALGIGGSPVPEPLLRVLTCYFPEAERYVIFGSSEAEPIAVRRVEGPVDPWLGYAVGAFHPALDWRLVPLGHLGIGDEVGEIEVRGPHVAAEPAGWLATGDFGYVRAGTLMLTGRRGNERLHQGVQHYQIEHLLQHVPGVERVGARADPSGFTVFVQGTVLREVLEERLRQYLPPQLRWTLVFRPSLPVDRRHHSKIQYASLR
jgi:acyl-CoA synthetase (AMP-forming)/AMP-acid ligase II